MARRFPLRQWWWGLACAALLAACRPGVEQLAAPVPRAADRAAQISLTQDFRATHPAPDYRLLGAVHEVQATDAGCSVASATMVVNALRLRSGRGDRPVSQAELLEAVGDPRWLTATAERGEGVSFAAFQVYLRRSLDRFGLADAVVEVFKPGDATAATLGELRHVLAANEASRDDFLVAAFDQGTLTLDVHVGHVSPIAAYDAEHRRVLVMDVDAALPTPYWTGDETLLAALLRPDQSDLSGNGLLRVSLPR